MHFPCTYLLFSKKHRKVGNFKERRPDAPDFFTNSASNHHNNDRETDLRTLPVNQHGNFRTGTGLHFGQSINTRTSALVLNADACDTRQSSPAGQAQNLSDSSNAAGFQSGWYQANSADHGQAVQQRDESTDRKSPIPPVPFS